MIKLLTVQHVAGLTAQQAYDFLLDFETWDYQAWWPDTHLQAKPLRRCPGHVGNRTFVDQWIGRYRLKMVEEITALDPQKKISIRVCRLGGLPIRMSYEFAEDDRGVTITYTTLAGFTGPLRILNPLFRVYFTRGFAAALDMHLKEEFLRLASLLNGNDEAAGKLITGEWSGIVVASGSI